MKFSQAIAVAAVALVGTAAFAQEATYEYPLPAVSQATRAEVRAAVEQARAEGTLFVGGETSAVAAQPVLGEPRTRAEVRAEAIAHSREQARSIYSESA